MELILNLHVAMKNNILNSSASCLYTGSVSQCLLVFTGLGTLCCVSLPLPVMEHRRHCFPELAALPGSAHLLNCTQSAKFRYLGTTVTNWNHIYKEINSRLLWGNACYHPIQNLLCSHVLYKAVKIEIYGVTCCFLYMWNIGSQVNRTT
jgi:hypothetical protein